MGPGSSDKDCVDEQILVAGEQGAEGKKLEALSNIPPFPPIAIRLLASLSDENVQIHQVVELTRADPKLSLEVLRRANSPLYGFISRVDSLRDALFLLGLDAVKALVLTAATGEYVARTRKVPELHRCWRHTLATALIAEELADVCSLPRDQAYTAGVLHDVGRLGLLVAYPDEYAELLRSVDEEGQKEDASYLLDLEKKRFGFDHCETGRLLAEQWGLPEDISVVAGRHHDRPYGNDMDLLNIVHLSCRFADTLGYDVIHTSRPFTFEKLLASLPERVRDRSQLNYDAIQETIATKIRSFDPEPEESFQDDGEENHESEEATAHDFDETIHKTDRTKREPTQAAHTAASFRFELVAALLLGLIVSATALLFWHS
jgi:putative nucleotidyltransferase with HDIG domain